MKDHDIGELADLLRSLPPAPAAWVEAAQQLPAARRQLDEIVARAEADVEFRQALVADLESALAGAGYRPKPWVVAALRDRFSGTS